jgi:hypothetical protein
MMRARMTCHQERQLTSVVTAAGLGAGHLSPGHMDAITTAAGQAEKHLRALLRPGGSSTQPPDDLPDGLYLRHVVACWQVGSEVMSPWCNRAAGMMGYLLSRPASWRRPQGRGGGAVRNLSNRMEHYAA